MLGYIQSAGGGALDGVLSDVAAHLTDQGLVVAGLVQVRAPDSGAHPCEMDLQCLPDGPVFGIAQALGSGARGCRLDIDALEGGAVHVRRAVETGADVFILNKFGAQEAQGRGFADTIALALEKGMPVLTVVNAGNLASFRAFAGGMEQEIDGTAAAILGWITAQRTT